MIHFYNLDNMKPIKVIQPDKISRNPDPKMNFVFRGHTASITDILIVPSRDIFFTCGMDAKIICWDLKTSSYHREFLGHKKGIINLAWISDFVISAGLDREAYIWNP